MSRTYTVAQARNRLPQLLHEVEQGEAVSITRRGRPVAVVMSRRQFVKLRGESRGFRAAYDAWRATIDARDLDLPREYFRGLRDRTHGRGETA